MTEELLSIFLREIKIFGEGTFFCTQFFESFTSENYSHHEIALHPYLDETITSEWMNVILKMKKDWIGHKEITGVRSHSCAYTQRLGVNLFKSDFKYVSNITLPPLAEVKPFRYPWGIYEYPIFYMDNMDFNSGLFFNDHEKFSKNIIEYSLKTDKVFIFDFHPIHLLLNSPDQNFYNKWFNLGRPKEMRYSGYGTLSFFNDLNREMEKSKIKSKSISKLK